MIIQESKDKIINTVKRLCEEKGVTVKRQRESTSDQFSNALSLYFELEYNGINKLIRISDHTRQHVKEGQKKLLSSMTIMKSTKMSGIERFIENRIKEMKFISLRVTLNKLSFAA